MSESNSSSNIMSVGEMIDTAFGEHDVNIVNHKLIQAILYILARQLRILERRVEIEIGPALQPSSSSLSVTEVKVHAMQKKKKRLIKGAAIKTSGTGRGGGGAGGGGIERGGGGLGSGRGGAQGGRSSIMGGLGQKSLPGSISEKSPSDKTSSDKTSSDKTTSNKTTSDKTSSDKTTSDKTSSDKTTSGKTSSDKTSSDKTSSDKTSSDKTTSGKTSSDKTSSDKTSSDKTTSDKTTSDKTSSDKTSSDKTSSDKTTTEKSSSDKTSSDKTSSDKTSTDKTSSDKTSTDKTSSDKTSSDKTSSDKTSSDKTSSDKTSTDKTSSDKTSSDKTSTDKTSSDKTSSDKTSSDKTSTDKTSSDKTTSDPTSSDKTSSKDKSSSDKQSSTTLSKSTTEKSTSDKTSTQKSSSTGKTTTDTTSSSRRGPGDYALLLETVEEQRETELRVIHQRADSREEHEKTPSPMASMDSVEANYEKLLVVERVTSDEARARAAKGRSGSREKVPRISVVTQEQFEDLAMIVRQLQQKYGPVGSASFPENIQLMHELRKGASLTDAMAALQLSARLEASEKALEQMMSMITDLASKTPGIDLTGRGTGQDLEVLFGGTGTGASAGTGAGTGGGGGGKDKGSPATARKSAVFQKTEVTSRKEPSPQESSSEESMIIPLPQSMAQLVAAPPPAGTGAEEEEKEKPDRITYDELDNAMQDLYDDIMKTVNNLTMKSAVNADNAFKIASKLQGKLEASLDLGIRMQDLETLVSDYSEQINILDTTLSSQMTNYQEELTQMQHDLETALETMAEVLANAGGDTTAVAELNAHFSNLQSDIEDTMMRQKELKNAQNALAFDLDSLRRQIEILRETKSDRDEVADALRDKAGLGALNGLVSLQQFDAVRGDMEKRIGAAYDKFNSQETIWQKVIDDLLRELNEKADYIQMISLKEDINKNLEILRCRLQAMMEIVGEPRAAAVAKKLNRDATCLSCATPADMVLEEHGIVPALPAMRPPAIGAEASKPTEDGDHGPCYPGLPIPHPRDPRSHVCQRWCGGSHTVVSNTVSRVPASMIITPAVRQVSTALGTDGKMYMVDESQRPCAPCAARKTTPQASIVDPIQTLEEDIGSDMTPSDFRPSLGYVMPPLENETPPPPQDDD